MTATDITIIVTIVVFLVFQIWLTRRVWQDDSYERHEKLAQARFIWFVPVFGPLIVLAVLLESRDLP